jgi:hypothetical protein
MGGVLRFTTTKFDWRVTIGVPRASEASVFGRHEGRVARLWTIGTFWYFATAAHHGLGGPALASQGVPAEDASEASILGRHEKRVARHWSIGTFW